MDSINDPDFKHRYQTHLVHNLYYPLPERNLTMFVMKGYGQFCPVAKAAEVVGERWTMLVIRELVAGSRSFNDIRRGVPLMSPSLLSSRLKMLESYGVVDRKKMKDSVVYTLTKAGEELQPIIFQMAIWGQRWVRSEMSKDDLDPRLLMWDIKRRIDTSGFSKKRTVLYFQFSDYGMDLRSWWLVVNGKELDVCLKDPGHEVDLFLYSDLKTMTQIWMGDTKVNQALKTGSLELTGNSILRKSISKWLGRNIVADVKPAARKKV